MNPLMNFLAGIQSGIQGGINTANNALGGINRFIYSPNSLVGKVLGQPLLKSAQNLASSSIQTADIARNRPATPINLLKTLGGEVMNVARPISDLPSAVTQGTLEQVPIVKDVGINTPFGRATLPATAGLVAGLALPVGGEAKYAGLTRELHPEDANLLMQIIPKIQAAGEKASPQDLKDLQNLAERYLPGKYATATTQTLAKTFDSVLEKLKVPSPGISDALKSQQGFINFGADVAGPKVPEAPATSQLGAELTNLQQKVDNGAGVVNGTAGTNKSSLGTVIDNIIKNGRTVLGRTPTGKSLTQATDYIQSQSSIDTGLVKSAVDKFRKLSWTPQELQNIRDVRAGTAQPVNQKVADAANFLNTAYEGVLKMANDAGIPTPKIPNYEPQIPKVLGGFQTPAGKEKIINYLISSGQAPGRAEAEALMEAGGLGKFGVSRFGPLDYSRKVVVPDELKITNPFDQLDAYASGAFRRIKSAQVFGNEGQQATKFINAIKNEGGDATYAKNYIDTFTGNAPQGQVSTAMEGLAHKIGTFESITKLGTSGIRNIQQGPLGSMVRNGTWNTVKAYVDLLKGGGNEFATQAGAITRGAIEDALQNQAGIWSKGMDIGAPGLRLTERWNRTVNALAGKYDALANFQRVLKNPKDTASMDRLAELGINTVDGGVQAAIKNGKLSARQLLTAANMSSAEGQHGVLFSRKILASQSPVGRLIYQFKNWPLEQTNLIAEKVIKEVKRGNLEPLVVLATAYPAAGEATNDIISFLRGKKRTTNQLQRAVEDVAFSGSLGILYDAVSAAQHDAGGVASFLMGPTAGDIFTTGGNIGQATQGNFKPLAKQAVQTIPVLGPTVKNILFPNQYTLAQPGVAGGSAIPKARVAPPAPTRKAPPAPRAPRR